MILVEASEGLVKLIILVVLWGAGALLKRAQEGSKRSPQRARVPPGPAPTGTAPLPRPPTPPPPLPRPSAPHQSLPRPPALPQPAVRPPAVPAQVPATAFAPAWNVIRLRAERVLSQVGSLQAAIQRDPSAPLLRRGLASAHQRAMHALRRVEGVLSNEESIASDAELELAEVGALQAEMDSLLQATEALARLLPARAGEGLRELILPAELFARDAWSRLESSLASRHLRIPALEPFVAFGAPGSVDPTAFAHVGLLAVAIPPQVRTAPWLWSEAERSTWRAAAQLVPHLAEELLERSIIPTMADVSSDALAAGRLAAAWRAELFAEVATTAALGPSAAEALVSSALRMSVIDRITIRASENGTILPQAPAHLRVMAACATLSCLGYEGDADLLRERWLAELPAMRTLVLRSTLMTRSLHAAPFEEHAEAFVLSLLQDPLESLGLRTVDEIAGETATARIAMDAQTAHLRIASGQAVSQAHPRVLLAASCLLSRTPLIEAAVLLAHRASLLALAGAPARARIQAVEVDRARPHAAGSPQHAVRDALILAEILSPPRIMRSA